MADERKEVLQYLAGTNEWLKISDIATTLNISEIEVHIALMNSWRAGGLIEDRNLAGRAYGSNTEFKITATGRNWLKQVNE